MTALIKVKVQRKAIVKLKLLPKFPANVVAEPGIIITRVAQTYTFSLDPTALPGVVGLVIGTNVQAFDADLSALAANSTNGLWAHTGAGTGAARTITGTANEITVTFGDGVSGNPTISIPAAVTFTGKTVTGGTFNSPAIANASFTGANTFTNAGIAAIDIRSGAAGSLANFTIGRTAIEAQFGVAASANQFVTGSAAGDSALAAIGAGKLWLVAGTFGISVNGSTGATIFPAGITVGGASVLGTPTSITLTNATGLPVSTGISGFGTGVATFLVTPSSANLRGALTDETGTGAAYFQGGDLGTPSAGVLTSATGLPISTGVSGLGTGVTTFLATPSSANLRGALTDESGTGAAYFQGGDLGTPSAGVLTSATGLPISTGVAGLGTSVATFLATPSSANLRAALTDEVGTGAAYFVGGALGTPASATLTNATGLPLAGLTTQAAFTFVANNTSGAAVPTAVSIPGLTSKASPVSGDLVLIADSAASNAWKQTTVGAMAAAGSVASLNGQTGAIVVKYPSGGRCTLTSATPVTASDVTAATSIYYTPANHDSILLYDGTNWVPTTFTELTLALDSTGAHTGYHQSGKNFHLGVYNDAGTIRLVTGPAWSTDTTTGTGAGTSEVTMLNGVLVNAVTWASARFGSASGNTVSAAANRVRIVGGFRASADGQTEDSFLRRLLSNVDNVDMREMRVVDTTDSWSYNTAAYRQKNASAANQVDWFHCVAGRPVLLDEYGFITNLGASVHEFAVGIGIDSTTTNAAQIVIKVYANNTSLGPQQTHAHYNAHPGIGYHKACELEYGGGADTNLWFGDNGVGTAGSGTTAPLQTGMLGRTLN